MHRWGFCGGIFGQRERQDSPASTPSLELPVSVLYISVPLGCLLMIAYYVEEFTQKK